MNFENVSAQKNRDGESICPFCRLPFDDHRTMLSTYGVLIVCDEVPDKNTIYNIRRTNARSQTPKD